MGPASSHNFYVEVCMVPLELRDSLPVPDRRAARVVLVVLDGLRADLVGDARFPHLAELQQHSAHTLGAVTVEPSVTAAAMTSLFSGVAPVEHGVRSDRFCFPSNARRLHAMPRVVRDSGLPATGIVRQVPWLLRPLTHRIVRAMGLTRAHFAAPDARDLLAAALPALRTQREGLIVMHWPDCDAAGHRDGWLSPHYLAAVKRMDRALGVLQRTIRAHGDDTLLIALADHGGGGAEPNHHNSRHPLDCTIPILLRGAGVVPQSMPGAYSLLDVPPTVVWALGLIPPRAWTGAPMHQAFDTPRRRGHAVPTATVSAA